jgi:hypothetical protein
MRLLVQAQAALSVPVSGNGPSGHGSGRPVFELPKAGLLAGQHWQVLVCHRDGTTVRASRWHVRASATVMVRAGAAPAAAAAEAASLRLVAARPLPA